jgi:hypothetical protein
MGCRIDTSFQAEQLYAILEREVATWPVPTFNPSTRFAFKYVVSYSTCTFRVIVILGKGVLIFLCYINEVGDVIS